MYKFIKENNKKNYLIKFITNNFKKKFSLIFIFIILLLITFVSGIIFQREGLVTKIIKPIYFDNFNIIERKIFSFLAKPEVLVLDIKQKEFMKLQFNREKALKEGTIYKVKNEWEDLKILYDSKRYNAKIKLKGAVASDHLKDSKWSFRIKLENNNTIMGMNEFAVMSPIRRNMIGQWFIRKIFSKEGIISRKYEFVNIIINGKNMGIYVLDERYDKIMLTRNKRKEGIVLKIDQSPLFLDDIEETTDRDNYYYSMDYTAFNLSKLLLNDE